MSTLFLKLLNMSIIASWLILAVIVLRLALKKAPKWMSCALWALVAVRLLLPFSFESIFSLIPSAETVSPEMMYSQKPTITSGIDAVNRAVNPIISDSFAPEIGASANPLQIWTEIAAYIWLIGVAVMLIYAAVSYLRLRKRVGASLHLRDNVWICDDIKTPFILGIFKPRVYLPSGMEEAAKAPVTAHENAHLQRRDHIWKPLGFLLLAVYWFDPLVWLAYILLCRDIELACDEKVVRSMKKSDIIAYSEALYSCSVPRRMVMACPLAFGEVGVKERIKTVLNYKRPAFWIIIVAVVACVVLTVCFLTNPQADMDIGNAVSAHIDGYMVSDDAAAELVSMLNNNKGAAFPVGADDPGSKSVTVQINCADGGFYVLHYQYFRGISFDPGTDDHRSILTWFYSDDTGQPASAQKSWKLDDGFDEGFRRWYDAVILENSTSASQALTLNDVITLSGKGEDLTWSDFDAYACTETGSGLYIRVYEIDEQFSLWIGGGSTDEPPMYIRLVSEADRDKYIDIRTEDAEAFITKWKNEVNTSQGMTIRDLISDDMISVDGEVMKTLSTIITTGTWGTEIPAMDPDYEITVGEDVYYTDYGFGVILDIEHSRCLMVDISQAAELSDEIAACFSIEAEQNADPLDAAVSAAILDHDGSGYHESDFTCDSHVTLATVSTPPKVGQTVREVIVYAMVLYQEYDFSNGAFSETTVSHIPTALTFSVDEDGTHTLTEYWIPRDGGYYWEDIRDKFPSSIPDADLDTQKYILAQTQDCYTQAVEYGRTDTDAIIEDLLDSICSSPASSSKPMDYIAAHPVEYRELTYYGDHTLQYVFGEFLGGGQTDLRGNIMRIVMEDLIGGEAIRYAADNGQDYFDEWREYIEENFKQSDGAGMRENYPKGWLLLQMTD